MSKELTELHVQEANALAMAKFFRDKINRLGGTPALKKRLNERLILAKQDSERKRLKRYAQI